MNIQRYCILAIQFLLCLLPGCALCCPDCLSPEAFTPPISTPGTGFCYEVETLCQDAHGNVINCPDVIPADCLYGPEAPQLCFQVTAWCGLGDLSDEQVGLQIAGQQINFWEQHLSPSLPGYTAEFCLEPTQISQFFAPGLAFQEGHLPPLYLTIDGSLYATSQVLIPAQGVVIGQLTSAGNYQWSENFTISSNLGLKICEGEEPQSVSGMVEVSFSESSGWLLGGTIEAGGEEQTISGSLSGSFSSEYSSGISYSTSVSTTLPQVTEEECALYGDTLDCNLCCFHLNAAIEQEIHQYELIEYDCDGNAQVQEELMPVIGNLGGIQFSRGGFITCPQSPLYLHPRKVFGRQGPNSRPFNGIVVDQFIDFDYYTLNWTGPNGFSAVNTLSLSGLEPGEYCYSLTHCGCEGFVNQGCLVMCEDANPISGWFFDEDKGLYCQKYSCADATGPFEECLDANACSDWSYEEQEGDCFREVCYEGALLFVETNAPYLLSYDFDGQHCQTIITCQAGEAEIRLETEPEYGEIFFDANEGECFQYVICGGQQVAVEATAIDEIVWEYHDQEGCIGTILCHEGSSYDGEVGGQEVETHFDEWSYDGSDGCLRDVTCSYQNGFEQHFYQASYAPGQFDWEYDDGANVCIGSIDCEGSVLDGFYSPPNYGMWDELAALYDQECIRDAFCGDPINAGILFEDGGDFLVSFESGPCIDGNKECYIQIQCDDNIVIGNDLVAEIPCEDNCGGNGMRQKLAGLFSGHPIDNCGLQALYNPGTGQVLLDFSRALEQQIEQTLIVELSTARIIKRIEPSKNPGPFTRILMLPSKGTYAIITHTALGASCYTKIIRH